jgi:hypothetical protein
MNNNKNKITFEENFENPKLSYYKCLLENIPLAKHFLAIPLKISKSFSNVARSKPSSPTFQEY